MKPRQRNIVLKVPESIMVSTVGEATGRPEPPREEGVIAVPMGVPVVLPVTLWIDTSYHRPQHSEVQKAWKVLNSIPVVSPANPVDLNDLLRSYKRLYALDTNTRNLGADKISVASPLEARLIGQTVYIHHLASFELRNVEGNPERVAWRLFIKARCGAGNYDGNARMGLIVDSELDLLAGINKRLVPVHDKFFLPNNIEMIYATSDGGKEMIANRLLNACEKRSEKLLQEICSNLENTDMLQSVKSECFSHKRWWPGETLDS